MASCGRGRMMVEGGKTGAATSPPSLAAVRLAVPLLGMVGMGVSAYLAYAHYRRVDAICLPGLDCGAVLSSPYARVWGVPLSFLGLAMYAAIIALGLLLWRGSGKTRRIAGLGAYSVSLSAAIFSLYLYYLEIFEIGAFCNWCIASSIIVFSLLALTSVNLFVSERASGKKAARRRFKLSDYIRR